MTTNSLTEKQAFDAMLLFLKKYWQLTKNQAAADLWDVAHYGVLDLNGNPATGDPAAWSDWMDYSGYDDTPPERLQAEMARDIAAFIRRVTASELELPLRMYEEPI